MTSTGSHGGRARRSATALLLIDVINDLEFPEGKRLLRRALPMVERLKGLAARARRDGVPVIWVNDNFGRWRSDFRSVIAYCSQPRVTGRRLVQRIQPDDRDFFVVKPMHSGFYNTSLALLLKDLGVRTVVLTGMATDVCVLFTANDAYMHGFNVVVVTDCVASSQSASHRQAIALMQSALKAKLTTARSVAFGALGRRRASAARGKLR